MFDVYLNLLRNNRNYRNLWLGAVVSQLGDWFNLIAAAALVARLTDSGTAISYLFLVRFLPLFLFTPLAGVLADRFDRRRLLIVSDLARMGIVLGFLLIRDAGDLWLFYALSVAQFAFSALFVPARTAVIANIVRRDELVTANALDSVTWSSMLAIGAALGGIATALFGITTAFILDAGTFILSAVLISRLVLPPRLRPLGEKPAGWLDFIDGFRYLRGQRAILLLALVKAGGALAWGAINVVEIIFAEQIFPLDGVAITLGNLSLAFGEGSAGALGLIYTTIGIGTGLGPVLFRHWLGDHPRRLRQGIALGFVLLPIGIFMLGVAPTLGIFLLGTFIRTLGSGTIWVFSAAWLQMVVPDRFRGRTFAFEFTALTLTQSLSIYFAGLAQESPFFWDVREVTAVMAGVSLVVGALWLLFQFRQRGRPLAPERALAATAAAGDS